MSNEEQNQLTEVLMRQLGPGFNPQLNFTEQNLKRYHNLSMYGGFALCELTDDYTRTYLDKIKIDDNDVFNN